MPKKWIILGVNSKNRGSALRPPFRCND